MIINHSSPGITDKGMDDLKPYLQKLIQLEALSLDLS